MLLLEVFTPRYALIEFVISPRGNLYLTYIKMRTITSICLKNHVLCPSHRDSLRGAGTGPAGPAVAGPMFTPSLRHDDVPLALTIQYYTNAAVTGHLSNWILPLSVLLRVKLVWPARLLHVDRAFVEAPPIIERDPQSRISHATLSRRLCGQTNAYSATSISLLEITSDV